MALLALSPGLGLRPLSSSRQLQRPGSMRAVQRLAVRAKAADKQQPAAPQESSSSQQQLPEPQPDFFEGESWEILGKVASFAVPIFLVGALLVGGFAAATYNEGATVFIDTPKSPDDTVSFYYDTLAQ